jgi:hypothetical protein
MGSRANLQARLDLRIAIPYALTDSGRAALLAILGDAGLT